jgi:serine/threonine protein kinase
MAKNTLKKNKLKKNKLSLKGGTYLGSGAYGCVITPPLPCKSSHLSKNSFINKKDKNRYVSKIIKYSDEDSKHELTISSKIKKIDPRQNYFITYESVCQIKKVPNNRKNTKHIEYKDNSLTKYNIINNDRLIKKTGYDNDNRESKTKCLIDTRLNPINIIMPYGGYDLFDLKVNIYTMSKEYKLSHTQKSSEFITTYNMITRNFKACFKHLAIGLYKLHKAKIVNCDIKQENIMALYNTKTKKVDVKYIDFGFSEHLTPDYCKHYSNIKPFGTTVLLPPEILITEILFKTMYKSRQPINIKQMTHNIKHSIHENVKEMLTSLKENEYVNYLYNTYDDATTTPNTKNIKQLPIIETLYNEIINHFNNKTILDAYFGINKVGLLNGYLQKADVYALGCTIYEFLTIDYKIIDVKHNIKLHHLLKKMIHPDPKKRFNILECLKHPYFKS